MRKETLSKTIRITIKISLEANISVCVIPSKSLNFCLRRTNCSPGVFKLKLGQELFWTLSIFAALKSLAILSALALNAERVRKNISINDFLVDRWIIKNRRGLQFSRVLLNECGGWWWTWINTDLHPKSRANQRSTERHRNRKLNSTLKLRKCHTAIDWRCPYKCMQHLLKHSKLKGRSGYIFAVLKRRLW